jgi:hypothetical protein
VVLALLAAHHIFHISRMKVNRTELDKMYFRPTFTGFIELKGMSSIYDTAPSIAEHVSGVKAKGFYTPQITYICYTEI